MTTSEIARLVVALDPELARGLQRLIDAAPKLEKDNRELRATLDAYVVELNRLGDALREHEAGWAKDRRELQHLKLGITAYRKRSATAPVIMDLDDADAWEASHIDADGQPTQET